MIASTQRIVKGIWIPIEIWCADDLNWNEKILLMEISSYTNREKDCYMSSEYVAKLLNITERSAGRILSSLMRKGYVEKTRFDGRKRYVRSLIDTGIPNRQESPDRVDTNVESDPTSASTDLNKITYIKKPNISTTDVVSILGKESPSCRSVSFDFKKGLTDLGITPETADAWIRVRKSKRAVKTTVDTERLSEEYGAAVEKAVREAGIPEWVTVKLGASSALVPEGQELPDVFDRSVTPSVKFTKPRTAKEA